MSRFTKSDTTFADRLTPRPPMLYVMETGDGVSDGRVGDYALTLNTRRLWHLTEDSSHASPYWTTAPDDATAKLIYHLSWVEAGEYNLEVILRRAERSMQA